MWKIVGASKASVLYIYIDDIIFLQRYYISLLFIYLFLGKIKIKMSKAISTFIV